MSANDPTNTTAEDEENSPTTIAEQRAAERIAAQRGVDPSGVESVELDAQGNVESAALSDEARLRRAAEQSETYDRGDLRTTEDGVEARPEARKQAVAQGTEYDADELRVEDGEVTVREPTERVDVSVFDDDISGDVEIVGPGGERRDLGADAGGDEPFFARVDAPDREGQYRIEVGGETVKRFEIGAPGAAVDRPGNLDFGWNGAVLNADRGETGARQSPSRFETPDEDVVAGAGAAEALQAGGQPERLSQVNPISEREGDQIADALAQADARDTEPDTQPDPIGEGMSDTQLATRGSEANRRLRQRVAARREGLDASQVDLVATDDGLAYQTDGDTIGESGLDFGGDASTAETAPSPAEAFDADGDGTLEGRVETRESKPSRGDVRAAVNRFGQAQLDNSEQEQERNQRPPLVEPEQDFSAVEIATGQAARQDPQFEQAAINDALGAVGLEQSLGFREPTREQTDPVPDRDTSALRFARGAGPRRQFEVESDTVGDAVRDVATDRRAQAAAAAGVVAPEPSTTLGGAALLATGALAAASTQQSRQSSVSPFVDEVDIPDEQQQSELETPEEPRAGEVSIPDGQQTVSPDELGVPQEAFEPDESGEIPADVSGGAEINDEGEVELPAEASGVVIYRDRGEEDEEDEDDAADNEAEEEDEEEEVAVEVPEELLPDEEVTIGRDEAAREREETEAETEPEPDERVIERRRQGQQSDTVEPDDTTGGEIDPPLGEETAREQATSRSVAPTPPDLFGGAGASAGGGILAGVVGDRDRDGTGAAGARQLQDRDIGEDLSDAPSSDVFEQATPRQGPDVQADQTADIQLDSLAAPTTTPMSDAALETAPQSRPAQQPTQTQPQQTTVEQTLEEPAYDIVPNETPTPEESRLPDLDLDDDDNSSLFSTISVDRVFDTGVVQSFDELDGDTTDPDPFTAVDDALDDLNF